MGLCAAMSVLPPAAAFLLRPRSSPSRFPSSSSSAAAVFWLFGRSDSVVIRKASSALRSSGPSSSSTPFYSSSGAEPGVESGDNYPAALRRRRRHHLRGEGCQNCSLQTRSSFRTFATMSSEFAESVANNPGLHETPNASTKGYFLQQTVDIFSLGGLMYRIKDPKVSLDFYTRVLGMSLLKRMDFPENKFSLYFVGYEDTKNAPTDPNERVVWTFGKTGTLELTHNWGTESDEHFKGHHNGNSDPRGYGHIGVTVDDTYKACERFESLGVKFVKKPDDGKMKGLAFIQDPDGYWIEIFDLKNMSAIVT